MTRNFSFAWILGRAAIKWDGIDCTIGVLKGKMEVTFELTTAPTSGKAEQVVWSTEGKPGLEI